jgi:hypothetical protein
LTVSALLLGLVACSAAAEAQGRDRRLHGGASRPPTVPDKARPPKPGKPPASSSTVHPGIPRGPDHRATVELARGRPLDRARESNHRIDGKRQVLTPASFGHVKSLGDLERGRHHLGQFRTESASKLLKEGEHQLALAKEGGRWRVYAARRGGARVHEATKVSVRFLRPDGALPPNRVHKGSFLFVLYFFVWGPWWGGLVVMEIIAYFP